MHCFIGNSEDRAIQKQSHSISAKRVQTIDIRMEKNGVMETPTLSF